MTPQIVRDMPEAEYHAHPNLSASQMHSIITGGVRAYRHNIEHPKEPTDAMILGSLFHEVVLGNPRIAEWDSDKVRRGKAWDEFVAKAAMENRRDVRDKDIALAKAMNNALYEQDLCGPLPSHWLTIKSHKEVSLFWHDPMLDWPCRGRIDLLPDDHNEPIVDFKSCDSLPDRMDKWWEQIADYGYDIQAANYRAGVKALGMGDRRMVFVLVTKSAPRDVAIMWPDDEWYERGDALRLEAVNRLSQAQLTGEWPGRMPGINRIPMPAFLRKESE